MPDSSAADRARNQPGLAVCSRSGVGDAPGGATAGGSRYACSMGSGVTITCPESGRPLVTIMHVGDPQLGVNGGVTGTR